MVTEISHRGPDDAGYHIDNESGIALGFRRLSIIDLSPAGHQPMSNPEGTIWIVFNGEIYNHLDLRRDLERKGYRYHSGTDTETILYAYQEYGLSFIEKLYGMFGLAIWDGRSGELILVRDRIGIKPLYYSFQDGTLYFGSEIKALLKHPDLPRRMNRQGLYDYLSLLITPPNQSLFEGIFKLEAGHYMIIGRDGALRKQQYWEMTHSTEGYAESDYQSEEFCIEEIRRLLRDSIRLRMMSDVPFGVLLSGGIDSSLNVALMAELMDRPVQTYSVGFKDLEKYNELEYARQVSKQFGTNHHELLLEENDVIEFLPKMIWHQDEPNADPVCAPMYFASKLARDSGTIVVQVGEGSDEQFSGYRHYLKEIRYFEQYYSRAPRAASRIAYAATRTFAPDANATEYFRRASQGDSPFYGGAISFSEEAKSSLLDPRFLTEMKSTGRIAKHYGDLLRQIMPGDDGEEYLRGMVYFELKSRLAELLLMRVDKMSMATSVEARVPFLDHRLVEFSFRIPQRLKIKENVPKYILKKASEGIIPDNIIYRRKQGFAAPIVEWLRHGKLHDFARERIFESRLLDREIFQRKQIERLFDRHRSAKGDHSVQIWTLMVACMWHETYIEG
jgi:asparagine synthase (glutamine-hydrolysing)